MFRAVICIMCIKWILLVLDTHYSLTCVLWSYALQHENLVWESQMPPASTYIADYKLYHYHIVA